MYKSPAYSFIHSFIQKPVRSESFISTVWCMELFYDFILTIFKWCTNRMSNKWFAKLGIQVGNIFWTVRQLTKPLQSYFDKHKFQTSGPTGIHKSSQIYPQSFALHRTTYRCKFGKKIWSFLSRCHLADLRNLCPLPRSQLLPEVASSSWELSRAGKKCFHESSFRIILVGIYPLPQC